MLTTTNHSISTFFSTNAKRLISPSGLELTEEQSQFIYWSIQWVYNSAGIERSELKTNTRFRLLTGLPGCGKAQPITTPILTPNGWVQMGELQVGDYVFSDDGEPTQIIGVYPQGIKSIYRVSFEDGTSTECCLDHLWLTKTRKEFQSKQEGTVRTTLDVLANLKTPDIEKRLNQRIPITKPLVFPKNSLPIDPYVLGVLIGDGYLNDSVITFTNSDPFIINKVASLLPKGAKLTTKKRDNCHVLVWNENRLSTMMSIFRELKLHGKLSADKFVPDIYKFASVEDRQKLLQGLMDTDGTVDYSSGRSCYYTTVSPQLAEDIRFLVESLGGVTRIRSKIPRFNDADGNKKSGQRAYTVTICLPSEILPFTRPHKKDAYKPKTKYPPRRLVKNIEYVGEKESQCIQVANPSGLYLTNNCIVTHNTSCSMTLVAMLKLLKFKVCLAAPTHQAKEVLIELAVVNNISVPCKTIYSLLGLLPEITEDGEEVFVIDKNAAPTLGDYDFIILDECSMINVNLWTQLKYAADCPLVLCMGDIEQLRPVKSEKKSPVFTDIKEQFNLSKVLRFQGAIAQYVSAIRNSSNYVNPAPYANGIDIKVCNKLEWFSELANVTNSDFSFRALAFKNKSVDAINKIVRAEYYKRKYGYSINPNDLENVLNFEISGSDLKATKKVFGWDELVIDDYLAGDKLLFKKPFSEWSYLFNTNVVVIPNGTKAIVTRAEKWELSGIDCYSLWVEWTELQGNGYKEIKQKQIYALAEHEKPTLAIKLDKLKQEALVFPKGRERSAKFKEYFKLRNQFADVQHSYCSTVHRCQGSTFDYVFVFSDLLECRDLAVQKELNYVACSRAKTKLIICQ